LLPLVYIDHLDTSDLVCIVCLHLFSIITGSIHPPVTIGFADEVVLNSLCPTEHVDSPPWSSK